MGPGAGLAKAHAGRMALFLARPYLSSRLLRVFRTSPLSPPDRARIVDFNGVYHFGGGAEADETYAIEIFIACKTESELGLACAVKRCS